MQMGTSHAKTIVTKLFITFNKVLCTKNCSLKNYIIQRQVRYIQIAATEYPSTQNICITFIQRPPNVFDVGPTLYKCYTNV